MVGGLRPLALRTGGRGIQRAMRESAFLGGCEGLTWANKGAGAVLPQRAP